MSRPVVSNKVAREYLNRVDGHWLVRIDHRCRLPVGAGYGTSGAAAASLSLALNQALGEQLSKMEALEIAHVADAQAKTGLGTVASVSVGGLALRLKPGAPGIGRVRKLHATAGVRVVSGSYGRISKPNFLNSKSRTERVNECSSGLLEALVRKPDMSSFLSLSRKFSDCLGLASYRLRRVIDLLDARGIVSSMMMLGDGVFSIVPHQAAAGVARLLRFRGMSVVTSPVGQEGAHLL